MKICGKCQTVYPDDMSFCTRCGISLQSQEKHICPACGKKLDDNTKDFCPYCGKQLTFKASNGNSEPDSDDTVCPACGKVLYAKNTNGCPYCGHIFSEPVTKRPQINETKNINTDPDNNVCPACGKVINAKNTSGCPYCGYKFGSDKSSSPSINKPNKEIPVSSSTDTDINDNKETKNGSSSSNILFFVIVIILSLMASATIFGAVRGLVVGMMFVFGKKFFKQKRYLALVLVIIIGVLINTVLETFIRDAKNKTAANTKPVAQVSQTSYNTTNNKSTQATNSYDKWMTIKMNDEIEFQIPPNLEIQGGRYKDMWKNNDSKGFYMLNIPGHKRIVAQQKGLNDLSQEAFSHYVRAIMEIYEFKEELPRFGERLNFSKKEVEEFGKTVAYAGQESTRTVNGKTQKITVTAITTPAKVISVNGNECIFMAYDSKLDNNPLVENNIYFFFNKNKMYKFTTMIRTTEYNLWTTGNTDVRNIVKTIKLVN